MRQILILGIGNVLRADGGFGVRCVERLAERYSFPRNVEVRDGGTPGLHLLPFLEQADTLLVFDAVDHGLAPGTLHVVEGPEVPAFPGARKISRHQTGFRDAIATARLLGRCPQTLVLIGCQPGRPEDDAGLHDIVAAAIDTALALALSRLQGWGIVARPGGRAHRAPAIRHAARFLPEAAQ
jgi:hydrogenase maturation protease